MGMVTEKTMTSAQTEDNEILNSAEKENASSGVIKVGGQEWPDDQAYLEDKLVALTEHLDEEDRQLVRKAGLFALKRHRGQKRLSGDHYIVHLVEVSSILAQYKLDGTTLAVAMMHDLIEEKTGTTLAEIKERFGSEIARLVDGVTRLTGLFSRQERAVKRKTIVGRMSPAGDVETLRKIFLAMARDLRAVLVKVADRLHNLRTLEYCTPEVQLSIAQETLDIFAPIVSRLGVWEFKAELEDLAFKYAYPEDYAALVREVDASRQHRQAMMMQCVEEIKAKLAEANISATISQRSKHLYSIFRKMRRQGGGLDEIYDLQAIRIIVNTIEECYAVLGMVQFMWQPMNDRIKDYIAKPKPNNYRSLHTTVFGPQNQLVEIQIRTVEMHQFNEFGVAAHFAYKEGRRAFTKGSNDSFFREFYPWIRALFDWQSESQDDVEFNEHLKVNLLDKDIFVFTPGGDVVDLPIGSTPLDFAYMVHTEVGHRCTGALVNGKMVGLGYKLQNADVVTIQTGKVSNPSRDWLRICVSHQALSKIRSWFKRECREENIVRGREQLRREFIRNHTDDLSGDEELMKQVAELLKFSTVDDLLASIGYGETSIAQVMGRIRLLRQEAEPEPEVPAVPVQTQIRRTGAGRDVIVEGLDNLLTKMAHCCNPAPGDDIVGYISLGKGLTVHRRSCPNAQRLKQEHPQRLVEASWAGGDRSDARYAVCITVTARDRSNLVGDLISVVNEARLGLRSCQAWVNDGQATAELLLEVSGSAQIEEICGKLRRVKSVSKVSRR